MKKIGERGRGGVIIKSWGVAFELLEVAVVGIGILFVIKRHERGDFSVVSMPGSAASAAKHDETSMKSPAPCTLNLP